MQKRPFALFIGVFISFFILFSCNDLNIVDSSLNDVKIGNEQPALNKIQDKPKPVGKIIGYEIVEVNGKKKKIPIYYSKDYKDIGIKALSCDYYSVYVNKFDHYEPKSGKNLGIMNQKPAIKSANELHNTWGFNGYTVHSSTEKNNMVNIGYDTNNIMVTIPVQENGNYTIPYGSFPKYYLDEPLERGWLDMADVFDISDEIYSRNNQAKLFMGSYKDDNFVKSWYSSVLQSKTNTRMMCDQYYDGTLFYGDDQRPYWTWFKNNYGSSRVKSHWIHILIDGIQEDFTMLFNHANNLGIGELWLYAGDANPKWWEVGAISATLTASNYESYLADYCLVAFNKGWLRKFIKRYKYMYHCPEYHGDPCWCSNNETGWELEWIQYLGIYEVYP